LVNKNLPSITGINIILFKVKKTETSSIQLDNKDTKCLDGIVRDVNHEDFDDVKKN